MHIKFIGVIFMLLLFMSLFYMSCHKSDSKIRDRKTRAYLTNAADVILSAIETHNLKEMPKRDSLGVDLIDRLVTHDSNLLEYKLPSTYQEPKDKLERSELEFSFPSTFLSNNPFVKSGFIKSDTRRYSFVFVALLKDSGSERWKKSSIIMTRDRDVIYQEDTYVDDVWIAENLEEFPKEGSKTLSLIQEFNNKPRTH